MGLGIDGIGCVGPLGRSTSFLAIFGPLAERALLTRQQLRNACRYLGSRRLGRLLSCRRCLRRKVRRGAASRIYRLGLLECLVRGFLAALGPEDARELSHVVAVLTVQSDRRAGGSGVIGSGSSPGCWR